MINTNDTKGENTASNETKKDDADQNTADVKQSAPEAEKVAAPANEHKKQ